MKQMSNNRLGFAAAAIFIALVTTSCASDGLEQIATSEANRSDAVSSGSLGELLQSIEANKQPVGRECDDVVVDPELISDGYIFDEVIGSGRLLSLDLDTPVNLGDLANLAERYPIGIIPEEYDQFAVLVLEGIPEVIVKHSSLGRLAALTESIRPAAILIEGAPVDSPGFGTLVFVSDRTEFLVECGEFSHEELINNALRELGADAKSAPALVEAVYLEGESSPVVKQVRETIAEFRRETPAAYESDEPILPSGFQPPNGGGTPVVLEVVVPRAWQRTGTDSTYAICFRASFGMFDCIATDVENGLNSNDDANPSLYVYVPSDGLEVWIDRYGAGKQGPQFQIGIISGEAAKETATTDGVAGTLKIEVSQFVDDPEIQLPEYDASGLPERVISISR